jgi:flagellar assembly factor FliW
MQEIATGRFGVIRYSPDDAVVFPRGLPGFDAHRDFVLLRPHELDPLVYLQSLTAPHPRFLLAPARLVDPQYTLKMEPWDSRVLFPDTGSPCAAPDADDLYLYFVVAAAPDASPTVNMLAPVAIRRCLRRGVQAVRSDTFYSPAAPLGVARSEAPSCSS